MERMRSGGASKAKRVREEDAEEAAPQGDSTSRVMGQFHTLLKQKSTARNDEEREAAQRGLDELGGMAAYQQLSLQMGFDASSYVIETLAKEGGSHNILDVGAIVHRYPKKDSRVPAVLKLNVKSIDLHSQDPLVQQADFFPFAKSNKTVFDAVVLSLVLNYVAEPLERGRMLLQTAKMLRTGGRCFIVLPAHCISNSRYLKFALFKRLLSRVGLILPEKDSYRITDKFFLCCAVKGAEVKGAEGFETEALYKRKLCRGGNERNNFCILLPAPPAKKARKGDEGEEEKTLPDKNLKSTSNQRRRARQKKLKETKLLKREAQKAPAAEGAEEGEEGQEKIVDFSE